MNRKKGTLKSVINKRSHNDTKVQIEVNRVYKNGGAISVRESNIYYGYGQRVS